MEDARSFREQEWNFCSRLGRGTLMKCVELESCRARVGRVRSKFGAAVLLLVLGRSSWGAFDTIINVPPDISTFSGVPSNTQVNVFDGGSIGAFASLGTPYLPTWPAQPVSPNSHIELNVYGGTVDYDLHAGSSLGTDSDITVNLFGGSIGEFFHADGGTTVNIYGGSIGDEFSAGYLPPLGTPSTGGNPIVVNMSGGSMGSFSGVGGGVFNLSGGYVGQGFGGAKTLNMSGGVIDSFLNVNQGSVANISGGKINYEAFVTGVMNVSGGIVPGVFVENGTVNVTGGTITSFESFSAGQLNISGGDYRLDGVPVAGLASVGSSMGFNIPAGSLLTGTLTDGTPFAITGANVSENGDTLPDGILTLRTTAIPAVIPNVSHLPGDSVPSGLHAGQSVVVGIGGKLGDGFTASWGSAVKITGGRVGDSFKAVGSVVKISAGIVGDSAAAYQGSVVDVSGGYIGLDFSAAKGSAVTITGGDIGDGFEARSGAVANISGGFLGDGFLTYTGSQLKISGGEFRLNGIPISGLQTAGSIRAIDVPNGAALSGTLSDGTPFAFTEQEGDYISAGTLTLNTTSLPTASLAMIQLPQDPAPKGLRTGQSMFVSDGVIGDKFTAGWGSSATITGGQIGDGFKAFGAMVNVSDGTFIGKYRASYGSLTNISGGSFNGYVFAEKGSVVNISGGALNSNFVLNDGSAVNIAGGTIGDGTTIYGGNVNLSGGSLGQYVQATGGTVNMTGGSIGQGSNFGFGSVLNFSGGTIGHNLSGGGRITVTGTDLRLNGNPITFDYDGQQKPINLSNDVLSGTLEDGTSFTFSGQLNDYFVNGSLSVQLSYTPLPTVPAVIQVPAQPAPVSVRSGQSVLLTDGGVIGEGFRMGWGSALTMTGGKIGDNLEAVGSQVTITGGSVGSNFNALCGTTVNIQGGAIYSLNANAGSIVNMTGGLVNILNAKSGSVVKISGSSTDPDPPGTNKGAFIGGTAEGGSEVDFFGTGFELNGTPIANLVAGQPIAIAFGSEFLSGFLADGTPFTYIPEFTSSSALVTVTSILYGDFNGDGVVDMADYVVLRNGLGTRYTQNDYNQWRSNFGRTSIPTLAANAEVTVPEPSAFYLLAIVIALCPCICRRR